MYRRYDHQLGTSDPDPPERRELETWLRKSCGWCGKYLGMIPGGGVSGETTGICPDCLAKEKAKLKAAYPDADFEDLEE